MLIVFGYIASVLMGLILGVIGGGGSILTVPILVYLMGVEANIATGYSLLIVGATAAFGAVRYFREGLIDVSASITFAIPSIIAVYVARAYIMPAIPDVISNEPFTITKNMTIMLVFAILMIVSAVMMLRKAYGQSKASSDASDAMSSPYRIPLIAAEGAIVGLITGLLGAGGGFLIIPALVLLLNMPMKQAVGASLFIIAIKSLIGFVGDLQTGIELQLPLLPLMLLATFIGMAASIKLANKLEGAALQKAFGFFTLIIAVSILLKELL